jgi:transposase-like protein
MGVTARKCDAPHPPTIGVSMDQDTNPECPAGHGEMMPAMGEVKKGEIRRIEQNWVCNTCGKTVTLPFP